MEKTSEELGMVEEGCKTPRHGGCRIPAASVCPPAPRKKMVCTKRRDPPKNGYFQPPDLESLFVISPRREACAQ
ncbi:hypothetical protein RJ641_005567 [Dillenia turbinata]|uniref:Cyclin-dependent protein kinase inhibitor SMR4 n=1 Tax=Dillenia turbinata TaxID=194707 RepID=A0AAN8VH84_9MAGN